MGVVTSQRPIRFNPAICRAPPPLPELPEEVELPPVGVASLRRSEGGAWEGCGRGLTPIRPHFRCPYRLALEGAGRPEGAELGGLLPSSAPRKLWARLFRVCLGKGGGASSNAANGVLNAACVGVACTKLRPFCRSLRCWLAAAGAIPPLWANQHPARPPRPRPPLAKPRPHGMKEAWLRLHSFIGQVLASWQPRRPIPAKGAGSGTYGAGGLYEGLYGGGWGSHHGPLQPLPLAVGQPLHSPPHFYGAAPPQLLQQPHNRSLQICGANRGAEGGLVPHRFIPHPITPSPIAAPTFLHSPHPDGAADPRHFLSVGE